jgi:hypothetical protein
MMNMPIALAALVCTLLWPGIQATAGGFAYTAPAGWQARPAASAMRVAEFVVPRAPGDAEDAEVIIYYFGGTGGSADANVDRWIGQVQQPDGSPSKDKAKREQQTINGLKVTLVDVSGTYVAEVRPGSTERHNKPGFRVRAAVIETPRGPYYVKMTGPAKTVAASEAAYAAFLRSLKPSAP